jgi:general secretion pathway protein M
MIKKLLADMQPRERQLVIAAAALLVLFIAYLLLWQPYGGKRLQALRDNVAEQRATLAWMQQAALRAQQLRGGGAQAGSGQSLMTVVDQTAKKNDLSAAMKRIEPAGDHSVRVWIEQASFDTLASWLNELNRSYSVHVQLITMDREAGPGRVNARITLEGGA